MFSASWISKRGCSRPYPKMASMTARTYASLVCVLHRACPSAVNFSAWDSTACRTIDRPSIRTSSPLRSTPVRSRWDARSDEIRSDAFRRNVTTVRQSMSLASSRRGVGRTDTVAGDTCGAGEMRDSRPARSSSPSRGAIGASCVCRLTAWSIVMTPLL